MTFVADGIADGNVPLGFAPVNQNFAICFAAVKLSILSDSDNCIASPVAPSSSIARGRLTPASILNFAYDNEICLQAFHPEDPFIRT